MSGIDLPGIGDAGDKDALLYDYSKHLLSLALLGIGGIVTLTQSPLGRSIPPPVTVVMLVAFAVSGACALTCSAEILKAAQHDLPVAAKAWRYQRGATLFLGLGVGAFLAAWIGALV